MGVLERQQAVRLYRGHILSPGRPTVAWRQDRVRFWEAIAAGAMTEDAAAAAGVSSPVGFRWFRHAGGVNPRLPVNVSGRYLFGGVAVNATGSNKRWLHGPGRTNRFRMLYVAAHVHPFVVALVVPGFSWTAAVVVYASVVSAALAITACR